MTQELNNKYDYNWLQVSPATSSTCPLPDEEHSQGEAQSCNRKQGIRIKCSCVVITMYNVKINSTIVPYIWCLLITFTCFVDCLLITVIKNDGVFVTCNFKTVTDRIMILSRISNQLVK